MCEPPRAQAQHPAARLGNRLSLTALLSVPVLLISMISSLQFDNWQRLSLQLATPVVNVVPSSGGGANMIYVETASISSHAGVA